MRRAAVVAGLLSVLAFLGFGGAAEAANPTSLLLSQSTAFSILGHSCGGIQEQAFATGFDAVTGYAVGDVYLQTRCSTGGRGSKTATYSAWAAATWDWTGTARSTATLTAAPAVSSTFSTFDAHGDEVYNVLNAINVNPANCTVSSTTYCSYRAYLTVQLPAAPTGVTATQSGGQYLVAWVPDPNAAAQITSSTVTATPVGSTAPIVTASVSGTGTSALIGPLQPQTTYQITVVDTDLAGPSPSSTPVSVTTPASSLPPGAPTGVQARWTAPGLPGDQMVVTWLAAPPGDSPTDAYQVTISGSDGGGTFTQTVAGSTPTTTFTVSDIPDWTVEVRAHDAAGWGAWSTSFLLGGA